MKPNDLLTEGILNRPCRRFGCSVCGEGGEFETLTLDCPLFTHGCIVLDDWTPAILSPGDCASVGVLHPVRFHVEAKDVGIGAGEQGSAAEAGVTYVPADYVCPMPAEEDVDGLSGGGAGVEVAEQRMRFQEGNGFVSAYCEGLGTREGMFAAAAFHAALVLIQQGERSFPMQF